MIYLKDAIFISLIQFKIEKWIQEFGSSIRKNDGLLFAQAEFYENSVTLEQTDETTISSDFYQD